MRKVYHYDNCKVIIHIPDDDQLQERLRKASENFMKKVMSDKKEHKSQKKMND